MCSDHNSSPEQLYIHAASTTYSAYHNPANSRGGASMYGSRHAGGCC